MSTQIVDDAAVERAYRTLAASISSDQFHRFVSQRTSGDDEWLEAALAARSVNPSLWNIERPSLLWKRPWVS